MFLLLINHERFSKVFCFIHICVIICRNCSIFNIVKNWNSFLGINKVSTCHHRCILCAAEWPTTKRDLPFCWCFLKTVNRIATNHLRGLLKWPLQLGMFNFFYERIGFSLIELKITLYVFLFLRAVQGNIITLVIKGLWFLCNRVFDGSFHDMNTLFTSSLLYLVFVYWF